MSAALRLGLVGCGRIAEHGYLPALSGLASIELTAVADPDRERRELIVRRSPGPVAAFASVDELLADGRAEAVVVAGPAATHPAAAEAVAGAGLPCLVEKPPALDAGGARRLAVLEPAPYVGFNRRFQYRDALMALERPAAELDVEIEIDYRRRSWRPLGPLGDAWLDLGPHLVDLAMLVLTDSEVEVEAAELGPGQASARLAGPAGAASLRCAIDRPHRESLAISANGRLIASFSTPGPLLGLLARIGPGESQLVVSLRDQLREFAVAARGGRPELLATAADGAEVMAVVDRVRELAGAGAGV